MKSSDIFDICIVGGGINGAGIARDAVGRGYRVLLLEKDDLAQATSSSSTKLVHGGLRYLERYDFKLVAKSLRERDVLLNLAPHIIQPLRFIMPYIPHLRPLWMIRTGLWIYDILAYGTSLDKSNIISFKENAYNGILKNGINKGIAYSDCRVDDARLVVLNAMDARNHGATVRSRTACRSITPDNDIWRIETSNGEICHVHMVINAAGPWATKLIREIEGTDKRSLRLSKGSHIVVPRIYQGNHAYILQNTDGRIVFTIPYEGHYTLIGTTDVDMGNDPDSSINIDDHEINYLCTITNQYFQKNISPSDIVWGYAGIRPLIDEATGNISKNSRDYRLDLQHVGGLPLLSVLGGKLTTYRVLAQEVVDQIDTIFNRKSYHWTAHEKLPGGDIPDNNMARFVKEQYVQFPFLSRTLIHRYAYTYGTCTRTLLKDVQSLDDMGCDLGGGVYGRELDYLHVHELAMTGDDVLWRRTKLGLHLDAEVQKSVREYMERKNGKIHSGN